MQNVKERWKTSCFDVSCTNLQPKASLFRAQHHASSLFRNTYHASKAHGRITFMQGLTIYLRLTVGRMGKGVGRTEMGGWAITGSTSVLGLFPQGFIGSFFSLKKMERKASSPPFFASQVFLFFNLSSRHQRKCQSFFSLSSRPKLSLSKKKSKNL